MWVIDLDKVLVANFCIPFVLWNLLYLQMQKEMGVFLLSKYIYLIVKEAVFELYISYDPNIW